MGFFKWLAGGARRPEWVAAVFEDIVTKTKLQENLPASYTNVKKELRASYYEGFDAVGTSPASLPSQKELDKSVRDVEKTDELLKQLISAKPDLHTIVTRYMGIFYRLGNLLGTFNYLRNTHAFTEAELKTWTAYFERLQIFDIMKNVHREFLSVRRPIEERRLKRAS